MASILAVPGLSSTTPQFRQELWRLAARNGWDVDAIATVISHESRFRPTARSSTSSATGILQWIESTARALGTSTAALERMSALEQLHFVEAYYRSVFGSRIPPEPAAYLLAGYGRADLAGKSGSLPLWAPDSAAHRANPHADLDGDGVVTVADVREDFERTQALAKGQRIPVDAVVVDSDSSGGGLKKLAVAVAALLLAKGIASRG